MVRFNGNKCKCKRKKEGSLTSIQWSSNCVLAINISHDIWSSDIRWRTKQQFWIIRIIDHKSIKNHTEEYVSKDIIFVNCNHRFHFNFIDNLISITQNYESERDRKKQNFMIIFEKSNWDWPICLTIDYIRQWFIALKIRAYPLKDALTKRENAKKTKKNKIKELFYKKAIYLSVQHSASSRYLKNKQRIENGKKIINQLWY